MTKDYQQIIAHLIRCCHLTTYVRPHGDPLRLLIRPSLSKAIASYSAKFQLDEILLAIIRSVDCRNSLVSFDEGAQFIVFDLSYIEFVHRLSNVDSEFPLFHDRSYLQHHLLINAAAQFLSKGFPLEATLIWAAAYRVAHEANILEYTSHKVTRKSRLGLQARYVLLHEIAHYLIDRRSDHIRTNEYDQIIDAGLELASDKTVLRETWAEASRSTGWTNFDHYRTQMEKLREGILAGDLNRDEIYCDCFACETLLKEEIRNGNSDMDAVINLYMEIERARHAMEERDVTIGFVRTYEDLLFDDVVRYYYNIEAHARAVISAVVVRSLVDSLWRKSGILTVPFTQLTEYLEAWSSRSSAASHSFTRLVSVEHLELLLNIDLRALREEVRSRITNGITEGHAREQCQTAFDYGNGSDSIIDIINSKGKLATFGEYPP